MEKPFELRGKVALITGSMSGIGLETAKLFLNQNLKGLISLDIVEDDNILKELKDKNNGADILHRKCDVSDAQDLLQAYNEGWNHFGYVHVAVHSAGINDESDSRRLVCVNVAGLIDGSMWLWNRMRTDAGGEGGTIINISSVTGILGLPPMPIYSATKQAIRSFSECLGSPCHYGRTGVRVLVLCPGLTHTSMATRPTQHIDDGIKDELKRTIGTLLYQKTESAARAVMDICKNASSGTVWVSHLDLPVLQHLPRDENELIEAYFSK